MKKTLAILLALSMILCFAACGSTAQDQSASQATASEATAEPTAEPVVETTQAPENTASPAEVNTAAYQAFLQNQSNVTVDAELEELSQGSSFTLAGLEEAFLAGLKESMWLENPSVTGEQAAFIDCGSDGVPELALRLTVDTQQSGDLMEDFVICNADDGLHLVAAFTTYYRTYSNLYTNGLAVYGGANSAFSSSETWYYVNADGQKTFLYSAETYPCLDQAVIPQEAVPTTIWDQYPATEISGSGNITLNVYNFTNDQSDYDAYMQHNLYVFTDENGADVAVDDATAQTNESFGLQVLSSADIASQIEQVYTAAGVPGGTVAAQEQVQWQELSALVG